MKRRTVEYELGGLSEALRSRRTIPDDFRSVAASIRTAMADVLAHPQTPRRSDLERAAAAIQQELRAIAGEIASISAAIQRYQSDAAAIDRAIEKVRAQCVTGRLHELHITSTRLNRQLAVSKGRPAGSGAVGLRDVKSLLDAVMLGSDLADATRVGAAIEVTIVSGRFIARQVLVLIHQQTGTVLISTTVEVWSTVSETLLVKPTLVQQLKNMPVPGRLDLVFAVMDLADAAITGRDGISVSDLDSAVSVVTGTVSGSSTLVGFGLSKLGFVAAGGVAASVSTGASAVAAGWWIGSMIREEFEGGWVPSPWSPPGVHSLYALWKVSDVAGKWHYKHLEHGPTPNLDPEVVARYTAARAMALENARRIHPEAKVTPRNPGLSMRDPGFESSYGGFVIAVPPAPRGGR